MRHKVKIETLSSVHVGSGETLMNNCDYIVEGDSVYIISPEKLGQLIGTDQFTIDKWVAAINDNSFDNFLATHTQGAGKDRFSSRVLANWATGEFKKDSTLSTCIHDGRGLPYIPGSTIKGAIRTAITASLMKSIVDAEPNLPFEKSKSKLNRLFNKDEKLNPQYDIFRFLLISDAYFEIGSEAAVKLVLLNQREKDELIDKNKAPQIVEVIDKEFDSIFTITIDKEKYDIVAHHCKNETKPNKIATWPNEMSSVDSLFKCINAQTKRRVDSEISYWEDYITESGKNGADDYIANLKSIKARVNSCREGKECVLRIGQGIGWRFITGAWAENLENFEDYIPKIRPKNDKYSQYDFPKSRRIDDESYLLGFVKLTLVD